MTVRVTIDLNTRVRGSQSYAGLEDADSPVVAGQAVLAVEAETGLVTNAIVTDVDRDRRLMYLAVDWRGLRADPGGGAEGDDA